MSKNSFVDVLVFLTFAGISIAVKYLEWKKKAPKLGQKGVPAPDDREPADPSGADSGEWEPDYETLKEFAEEQKRAGRPLDPDIAAVLEALAPQRPEPEIVAGPSEAEVAMLEEQRRLAELAEQLEKRRADAAAAFAPAPEDTAYAVEDDSAAEAGSGGDTVWELLRSRPRSAVLLAEILAPPVGLRSGASR